MKRRVIVWVLVGLAGFLYGSTAVAKPVEVIEVYAGRAVNTSDGPIPYISVVPGKEMTAAGLEHPNQYLQSVPGAWISRGSGQEHLTAIRSPVLTGAGSCGAFLMAEDGIALRAKGFCNANQLFDAHFFGAESVEVFKGPAAAFLGSNAVFGGMNIRMPKAHKISPRLSYQQSSNGYKQFNAQSTASRGAHDFGAITTVIHDSGWRDDSGFGKQHLTFNHHWQGELWQADSGVSAMHLEQETAGYIYGSDAYKSDDTAKTNPNPEAYRDADSVRIYSRWTTERQHSKLSVTPYARYNDMAFLMHFVPWQPTEFNRHTSVGTLANWQIEVTSKLSVQMLMEFEKTQAALEETQYQEAPFGRDRFPIGGHYDYTVDAFSLGASVGATYKLTDTISLAGTVRGDTDEYDYDNLAADGWACDASVTGCRFYRPSDQKQTFSNTAYDLGLNARFGARYTGFIKIADGYRVPQATELFRAQSEDTSGIETERISSVEIGLIGNWQDNSLQLAMFSMSKRDGLYQDPERRYLNGVKSSHQGVEYQLQLKLMPSVNLDVSGSLAFHKYENNPHQLGVKTNVNIEGNWIDTAPKHQHQSRIHWTYAANADIELQWLYMGEYFMDPQNLQRYPGHEVLNLRSSWHNGTWHWSVALMNAFDKSYADRADVSFGDARYFPAAGRSLTVGVTKNFQ